MTARRSGRKGNAARPLLGNFGYASMLEQAYASGHITTRELLEQSILSSLVLATNRTRSRRAGRPRELEMPTWILGG